MKFKVGDKARLITDTGFFKIETIVTITDVHSSFYVCECNGITQFLNDDELEPLTPEKK
jgi:hypothetical protein